ncbi:MAG: transposase [Gammaproteobacteria bacterium]|nr:transposase [Gammaproteobacteria bacterium]
MLKKKMDKLRIMSKSLILLRESQQKGTMIKYPFLIKGCRMRELEKVSIKKYGNILEITVRLPWTEIQPPQIHPYQPIRYNAEPTPPRKPLKYDLFLIDRANTAKRRKSVRAAMKNRAVALRLEGKSVESIARSLARSPVTIYAWLKQHKDALKG